VHVYVIRVYLCVTLCYRFNHRQLDRLEICFDTYLLTCEAVVDASGNRLKSLVYIFIQGCFRTLTRVSSSLSFLYFQLHTSSLVSIHNITCNVICGPSYQIGNCISWVVWH